MDALFDFVLGTGGKQQGQRQKKKGASSKGKKRQQVSFDSFEDYTHLVGLVDYEMRNRRVGAYLLRKEDSYQFVFGFMVDGFHPSLTRAEMESAFDKLEAGLKDFPHEESLKIHYEDFRGMGQRGQELNELWANCANENIQLILKSQQARDQELAREGKRREKQIVFYVTHTFTSTVQGESSYSSWVEKALAWTYAFWEKLSGERRTEHEKFSKIARAAFIDGYLRWENFLSVTLGLTIKPLQYFDLWRLLWKRFNKSKPIEPPQVIRVTREGVTENLKSLTHPATLLCAEGDPVADEQWVYVRRRYVAPLFLVEKPGGWASKTAQLKYLWTTLLAKERVYDIEIFSEIRRANDSLVRESVRRLLAQSLTSSKLAGDAGTIDVAAQIKAEKAIEAQAEIFEGSVPFWLGFVILVHRDNLEDLDEACRFIESSFLRPTWVERERFVSWQVWLQTLPIYFGNLLVNNTSNRRHLFLHTEVTGLLPLIKPQPIDQAGLEFLTAEGGYPIFIDLYNSPRHVAIFATTRAGKSVLTTYPFIHFLAKGMGVIILDYPRMDGTSTYTDLVEILGGAYIDISKEAQNCMEIPDFSHYPKDKQRVFFDEYKAFIKNLYFMIVMGTDSAQYSTRLGTQVRGIIDIAVENFFSDPEIRERYERGKIDPQEIPTGRDFFPFVKPDRFSLDSRAEMGEAFGHIELRLTQFFASSIGKAITSPSTVRPNNPLTVYAFTNVSNEEDAAILSVVALTAALRNSLRYPRSLFFIDEAPILFEFSVISDLIGRLCANGAKAGISVCISAQDPNTVANASSGSKIIQNIGLTLVGRIKEAAVDSFVTHLGYDRELIAVNATKAFFPKKTEIYSQWLVDHGEKTFCRFYPGILQLALVANNPDEQKMRDVILSQYPDKYSGYKALCEHFLKKLRE
jgi:hypothetical protein